MTWPCPIVGATGEKVGEVIVQVRVCSCLFCCRASADTLSDGLKVAPLPETIAALGSGPLETLEERMACAQFGVEVQLKGIALNSRDCGQVWLSFALWDAERTSSVRLAPVSCLSCFRFC
jgi:hypothetical protein